MGGTAGLFLLASLNVDSACVTKCLRLKRLMQRHVCCFSLKPLAIVVHHFTGALEEESVRQTSTHIKLAKPFLALSAQNINQHLPYKTSFCFFKTISDFCSSNSGISVMTLILVHLLSGFLLLPQTLHSHSADSALCCAPFVSL